MTDRQSTVASARLRLVPATTAMVTADLEGPERLAQALQAEVPPDWPPEHHDADTLVFWRDALSRPGSAGWWLHYVLLVRSGPPALIGTVAYKGPPTGGVVEIGYSVVPSRQRQGLATEASRALIESAWKRGADVVVAHTLHGSEPSIGVLRKLGFARSDSPERGVLAFALRRPEARSPGPR